VVPRIFHCVSDDGIPNENIVQVELEDYIILYYFDVRIYVNVTLKSAHHYTFLETVTDAHTATQLYTFSHAKWPIA
jgi:hypothetical protein